MQFILRLPQSSGFIAVNTVAADSIDFGLN